MRVTKLLATELRNRSYRVAIGLSLAVVGWAWMLTGIAWAWPSLTGLVACLAVPYLAWTYVPGKLIQAIDLTLAPGLLAVPSLPILEAKELAMSQLWREVGASLLLALVAGVLYGSLAGFLDWARSGRLRIVWRWVFAQGVGSLITACYLLIGLLIEAYGRTTVLGLVSSLADGLLYLPLRVVRFFYGQEPTLQRWGDWDVATMLAGTGLLATLVALVVVAALSVMPRLGAPTKAHRSK